MAVVAGGKTYIGSLPKAYAGWPLVASFSAQRSEGEVYRHAVHQDPEDRSRRVTVLTPLPSKLMGRGFRAASGDEDSAFSLLAFSRHKRRDAEELLLPA